MPSNMSTCLACGCSVINLLENVWGGKRFLTYFMITGLGAAALHLGVNQLQISLVEAKMTAEQISMVERKDMQHE